MKQEQKWIRRARWFMLIELLLSLFFSLVMILPIRSDHLLYLLMVFVLVLNILTASRLFIKLNGTKCASSIMVYVAWKIIQLVILIPVLVILSFYLVDDYVHRTPKSHSIQILLIIWIYAAYSLLLICLLAWLARRIWKRQESYRQFGNTFQISSELPTSISYIDEEFKNIEMRAMIPYTNVPYDYVTPSYNP